MCSFSTLNNRPFLRENFVVFSYCVVLVKLIYFTDTHFYTKQKLCGTIIIYYKCVNGMLSVEYSGV